jgi:cyclophilin family peptidyl-prolyl cis-trans isomerase
VDKFYPFGEVISGMDVVRELVQGDVIESVTIEVISR